MPAKESDRPRRADARRNYERLLATADTVLREQGTDASLEEIARRAGVGVGTLYRHFPTRDALLEALLHDRLETLRERAGALAAAHPPRVALERWLRDFLAHIAVYRGLPASVLASMRAEGSQLYGSCHATAHAGERLIRDAQRSGAIRRDLSPRDVLALVGAISWAGEQFPNGKPLSERLLRFVLQALAGEEEDHGPHDG